MDNYPEYSENDFRLYHHGILGQHWGKKNGPPYPLDAADHSSSEKRAGWRQSLQAKRAERKAAKNYDYRESDSYKKGNSSKKAALTQQHNTNRALYGKKGANRVEYDTQVKGLSYKDAKKNELKRKAATAAAITVGGMLATYAGTQLLGKGLDYYSAAKNAAKISNAAAEAYAKANGLNTIKGGFTMGAKNISQGVKLARKYGLHI